MTSGSNRVLKDRPRAGGAPPRRDQGYDFAVIEPKVTGGAIGLSACPGCRDGRFVADCLASDVERIAAWGAEAVICLLAEGELESLSIDRLSYEVRRHGIGWLHLPITDMGVPDAAFEREWSRVSGRLRQALANGSRVLVHCKAGIGRSGLFVARLLIEAGADPEEAIAEVRAARPGAIETDEQEACLRALPGKND